MTADRKDTDVCTDEIHRADDYDPGTMAACVFPTIATTIPTGYCAQVVNSGS